MRRLIASVVIIAGCTAPLVACETAPKADKKPVEICSTKGYHKAGRAGKAGKGEFLTCGGTKCIVTYKFKNSHGATRKVTSHYTHRTVFTIPKWAKSWDSSNCGIIYRRNS